MGNIKMKSIDDIVVEKIYDLINVGLSKIIKPDITIDKITQLDENSIKELKEEYDIEGIILDVDETIRKDMKDIPKCNKEWIEKVSNQIKISIVSNGMDKNLRKFFQEQGIDYIEVAHKPLKKNFIKACENMDVNPEKVLVIGDRVFSDILGGKRNNMKTVLVKTVEEER